MTTIYTVLEWQRYTAPKWDRWQEHFLTEDKEVAERQVHLLEEDWKPRHRAAYDARCRNLAEVNEVRVEQGKEPLDPLPPYEYKARWMVGEVPLFTDVLWKDWDNGHPVHPN